MTCPYCQRPYQVRRDPPHTYGFESCRPCPICPEQADPDGILSLRSAVSRYLRQMAPIGPFSHPAYVAAVSRCHAFLR